MTYEEFINQKKIQTIKSGFTPDNLNKNLKPHQILAVTKALESGRYALFLDTGLGKTLCQLEWANQVAKYTNKPVLILAPLAVVNQTKDIEGKKWGIDVGYIGGDSMIQISNYEQLDNIDVSVYSGVVLDESSILKSVDGKTKNLIIEKFRSTPYKLACSATPSPNDHMELGNHSEFLGQMTYTEMLAMFFVHDGGETSKWRLRKHAEKDFWNYILSWSMAMDNPKTFGFDGAGYDLPKVHYIEHLIETQSEKNDLFGEAIVSATDLYPELRKSLPQRLEKAKEIFNQNPNDQWIFWCLGNDEAKELQKLIPNSKNVQGSDSPDDKSKNLNGFIYGNPQNLITKAKIASFGMNYQHANHMLFMSYDFSFEKFYQAVRRMLRFGQQKDVYVHILVAKNQINVKSKINESEKLHKQMIKNLAKMSSEHETNEKPKYNLSDVITPNYKCLLGDCVQRAKDLNDNELDLVVFSPPFSELYVYSDKIEDMGNSKNYLEFEQHFKYLIPQIKRTLKKGRICAVHCMDLPIQKGKEGYIGLRDFSGMLIRWFTGLSTDAIDIILDLQEAKEWHEENNLTDHESYQKIYSILKKWEQIQLNTGGFIYHSRVTIWKNPVTEMQRTKALGLLHKTIKKDSTMSRVGIPDYVLFFRNGDGNENPVTHQDFKPDALDYLPVDLWQKYASPVWYDIDYGRTLQYTTARDSNDEKHIAPLQLETIERCIHLYSNEGETVGSFFGGIGSEGYQALKMNRKSVSIELKESYFKVNCQNHANAVEGKNQTTLF